MKKALILLLFLAFINISFSKGFADELMVFKKALKLSKKDPQKANILIKEVLSYHNPIFYDDALVVYAYLNNDPSILVNINPSHLTRGFVYEYYRLLAKINPNIMSQKPCFFIDKASALYQNQEAIKNALKGGCFWFAYEISGDSDSFYAKESRFYHFLFSNNFTKTKDILISLKDYKNYNYLKSFYANYIYKYLFFKDRPSDVVEYAKYVEDGFYKYFYEGISYFELRDYANAERSFKKALRYDKTGASYYWLYKSTKNKKYLKLASRYDDFYGTKAKIKLHIPIKTHFITCKDYIIDKRVKAFEKAMHSGFNAFIWKYYMKKHYTKKELCAIFHINPKFFMDKERIYDGYPLVFSRYIPKDTVNPYLVLAIMRKESFYNPIARTYWAFPDKESTTIGLMQVKDSTAQFVAQKYNLSFCDDMKSTKNSILYGSYYLKFLKGITPDFIKTIASYNAGPGNVAKYKNFSDTLLFIEHIPNPINQRYVKYVLNFYWHYKYGM